MYAAAARLGVLTERAEQERAADRTLCSGWLRSCSGWRGFAQSYPAARMQFLFEWYVVVPKPKMGYTPKRIAQERVWVLDPQGMYTNGILGSFEALGRWSLGPLVSR